MTLDCETPVRTLGAGLVALVLVLGAAGRAHAGAFFQSDPIPGVVIHPKGYDGVGGNLTLTVCVDPGFPNALAMETPVEHAVGTWNSLVPTSPNLVSGASNNIEPCCSRRPSRRRCAEPTSLRPPTDNSYRVRALKQGPLCTERAGRAGRAAVPLRSTSGSAPSRPRPACKPAAMRRYDADTPPAKTPESAGPVIE